MWARLVLGAVLVVAGAKDLLAQQRVLQVDDGLNSKASFDIRWISNVRCPAAIDRSSDGTSTAVLTIDCRSLLSPIDDVVADFILFGDAQLSQGWSVASFSVARTGGSGNITPFETPQVGATAAKTRLRLRVPAPGRRIIATLTINLAFTPVLPDCRRATETAAPRFVCTADNECEPPGSVCSKECGQRCIAK